MKLNPYLNFNGNCREAFERYQQILGGQLQVMTHGQAPACDQIPADWHDRVMHAALCIGEQVLMGADMPPEPGAGAGAAAHGIAVTLNFDGAAEADTAFAALADGGQVRMPLGETFWAERFGMVVDRFGTPWLVNGALRNC